MSEQSIIWVGITGSWRTSSPELESDVDREVAQLLLKGKGIVSGEALGVDYRATALALEYAPDGSRIKVFLPTTLEIYAAHYRMRAREAVITQTQAESLIAQLETVQRLGSLIVNSQEAEVNERTYYLRNTKVVKASNEMLAFQVNQSAGAGDTIQKARELGRPVTVFSYTV